MGSAIAVDWSGARHSGGRTIWLAEVADDRLLVLQNRWSGASLLSWLIARAQADPALVIGLDFGFSFPAWFVAERCGGRVEIAWERARAEGEGWLVDRAGPFWGRPGSRRPLLEGERGHFRMTELALNGPAGHPKSVFQVGGAGAVGTGSIRGMPLLAGLRQAGFSIWPFNPVALPLVVEIYPRVLTGPVVKRDPARRREYLAAWGWPTDLTRRAQVAQTEDSFDAAVSARQIWRHASDFSHLPQPSETEQIEGRIWLPNAAQDHPTRSTQSRV